MSDWDVMFGLFDVGPDSFCFLAGLLLLEIEFCYQELLLCCGKAGAGAKLKPDECESKQVVKSASRVESLA